MARQNAYSAISEWQTRRLFRSRAKDLRAYLRIGNAYEIFLYSLKACTLDLVMARSASLPGRMVFGILRLKFLRGKVGEYEASFTRTRGQGSGEFDWHFRGTRKKTISLLSKLGVEDSAEALFEAAAVGATSRHVSLRAADFVHVKKLLKG